MSVSRSNVYVRAAKGFSRWLWTTRRAVDDPLLSLALLNAKTNRRHVRRALTADELRRLVAATAGSGVTIRSGTGRIGPADRAMLFTLAAYTGLRASELASLTPASFDLTAATVAVRAAYATTGLPT